MNRKLSYSKLILNFIIIYVSILSYLGYIFFYYKIDTFEDYSSLIIFLSWLGILSGVYILLTWYQLTGTFFSLYTIFMFFFFLFNYGQPIMWAFGIHQSNEIGQVGLYTLGKPTTGEIAITQLLTLSSILLFHFGAFYSFKKKRNLDISNKKLFKTNKAEINQKAIYNVSYLLSFITIPVSIYNSIYKLIITQLYSYRDYYYNDNIASNIGLFKLIDNLFFPTLIGLLIGSNYRKNNRVFVYLIFSLYVFISIISGDRGNWIIKLIILIWMSHVYYKSLSFKKYIKYGITGILGLQILDAVTSIRNNGINLKNILNALSFEESAIISAVFEMGGSMRPALVLMKYEWDIWPYGNTYINSILGMISSRVLTFIGRPWAPLSDWFSQTYLKIPYGAAFSIVAESLINYGPIIAPLFMIVLGFVISSLTYLDKDIKIEDQPLRIFFAISTMSFLTGVIRNHFLWVVKSWFYGVAVFIMLIMLMRMYVQNKNYTYDKSI